MNRSFRFHLATAIVIFANQPAFAISYTATLMDIRGPLGDSGHGINNLGQAVGSARFISNERPLLYDGTLDYLDGGMGIPADINDAGHVIVRTNANSYLFNGTGRTLLDFDATAIANSGNMTGSSGPHAILYDGTIKDLGTLGGDFSRGIDVNELGQVTGTSYLSGVNDLRTFVHDGITMKNIGTLDGKSTTPAAINNLGHVVGTSDVGSPAVKHGFYYDGTVMHDLGEYVEPFDINNHGQVLLRYGLDFFLWTEATGMLSINQMLGPEYSQSRIYELTEINDSGQIVGTIYEDLTTLRQRMAVLSPVPEPATLLLAVGGAIMTAARSRMKRRGE